jgi:hypothetical protein
MRDPAWDSEHIATIFYQPSSICLRGKGYPKRQSRPLLKVLQTTENRALPELACRRHPWFDELVREDVCMSSRLWNTVEDD